MATDDTFNEYPRQLYHRDGRTLRAETEAEEAEAGTGWSRTPMASHLRHNSGETTGGSDPLAAMFRDILESVLDARGVGLSRAERAERALAAAQTPAPPLPMRRRQQEAS